MARVRNLIFLLGDQLDRDSAAFDSFDPQRDLVLMAEVREEATHVPSNKIRTTMFLSAMRHYAQWLESRGIRVDYRRDGDSLPSELQSAIQRHRPETLILIEPGEYRVEQQLLQAAQEANIAVEVREDRHFLCSKHEFAQHAAGKKRLVMEFFYREMRRKHQVLLDSKKKPIGGEWNLDKENRGSFGKQGPGLVPRPLSFAPDAITREVIAHVERQYPRHPGVVSHFDYPVTTEQALEALDDFIANRLPLFGQYQDAMWTSEELLYHSRLSAAMNLKLLDPRVVIRKAQEAFEAGLAPLAAVEGFIRQILGWREYVRGIYWHYMPEYAERNALDADVPLPQFYWDAQTDMNCMHHSLKQTLDHGYAHHIQRLMVTGLYSLLLGVRPKEINEWYLAVYVDAVEWVELPNVQGMSQFADGGTMATKPYAATGKYINKMSNYCQGCRYNPDEATGEEACPFTTLYWDFLLRHESLLRTVPRMEMQLRNLTRLDETRKKAIHQQASAIRERVRQQKYVSLG